MSSSSPTIPVAGPCISDLEVAYVGRAVREAWYDDAGKFHDLFEHAFADYVGRKHAMCLPSCTSAIHLALAALGVGPGDEVIVPELTWIATAAPICYVGATPIFADVDPITWCISAGAVEAAITPRTRAIIAVDLYGGMPDMVAIQRIAEKHRLAVIEDAAEAIGSEFLGSKAGHFGDVSVFSFHGSKTLTTGEGGMLVTDRSDVYERAAVLRDHGRRPGDVSFFNAEVGFKYKMSSLQAALGLAQLERIDDLVRRKRQLFDWYLGRLRDVDKVTLNAEPSGTVNSFWMTTAVVQSGVGRTSADVGRFLGEMGIATRPMFHPLSSLPAFRHSPRVREAQRANRVAYDVSPRGINLPSALTLTEVQVNTVCENLMEALR